MAARLLLRQRAMAPVTATLLASGIALYPTVAHAEAPSSAHPKKPIYDDYDAPPTTATIPDLAKAAPPPPPPSQPTTTSAITSLITGNPTAPPQEPPTTTATTSHPRSPTPTDRLAGQIRLARLWLYSRASAAESSADALLSRALDAEARAATTLSSLAPPPESGERLMPGAVYVLVASMAGSIVVRNRNVVLRAAGPVAAGVAAAWALLPATSANVGALLWDVERRRFPAVAEAHLRAREGVERGVSFAQVHRRVVAEKVEEKVREAREAVEGWVRKGN